MARCNKLQDIPPHSPYYNSSAGGSSQTSKNRSAIGITFEVGQPRDLLPYSTESVSHPHVYQISIYRAPILSICGIKGCLMAKNNVCPLL